MTVNQGSSAWMAPEVFKGTVYSEKCDVFSWAIILWQCLSRKKPYYTFDNEYAIQWAKVQQAKKPQMLRNCPSKLKYLITKCWDQDPDARLSMDEIVPIMKELFSHCSQEALKPLNLVFISNVPYVRVIDFVGKLLILIFKLCYLQPALANNPLFDRRTSNDDTTKTRDTTVQKQLLGHKRSKSSDTSIILDGPLDFSNGSQEPVTEVIESPPYNETSHARNFNAYLVLSGHYPIPPDISNSESMDIFEDHRRQSVRLLRATLELARLESYLKELENWEHDSNRDDARIYMRFLDENRNLKKLCASFLEQLNAPRNSNGIEVSNDWIVIDPPSPSDPAAR